MKITNKNILDEFVIKHADIQNAINKWVETIESNDFHSHNKLKELFPKADYVGNQRYVFDIKGNRYRLVVMIIFFNGLIEIRFAGTHAEYDKIKNIANI